MDVICPYCERSAELVTGAVIYPHRPDLAVLRFWRCAPCDAYVGCHPHRTKAIPLGRLADAELRQAKTAAHQAFDPMWRSGERGRKDAYRWLAAHLGIPPSMCHIGMFDVDRCRQVVEIVAAVNVTRAVVAVT